MDTWILAAFLGLGLAAATGLRTFLPLLMLSAVAHFGWLGISLSESFAWLGSSAALATLAIATVAELLADKIPLIDNALSALGMISRPVAAAIAAGAVFTSLDASAAIIAGIIVGAPTALAVGTAQAGTRVASTTATGGTANPIVSIAEDVVSFIVALVALVVPVLIPLVLIAVAWLAYRGSRRWRRRRPTSWAVQR
ncbi:DUF4126 domain-containing protein [Hoyosella sp. G463]|uniref:DUF4126 domain-containing protein n=1 Tax=Lolliginicoccus lacisalsi TaxID=2742202 RepID=A0A927J960_9ACTN|nr:DUF4126 domain-containing protein [Lolliginicoccus lacisalsi]MBD8504898.1 DUF4126 domain-containing protein [Lolliginicoccus lacisalsi]